MSTVKGCVNGHSQERPKIGFQDHLSLKETGSILQYFRPSCHKISFLTIFEWPFYTGCTVFRVISSLEMSILTLTTIKKKQTIKIQNKPTSLIHLRTNVTRAV